MIELTERAIYMQNASHRRIEDGTDENDKRKVGEFPLLQKLDHVKVGKPMMLVARWYGYGPVLDAVELTQHIRQHFIAI